MRCAKHTPEYTDAFRGRVRCTSCGKEGLLSNGSRKPGRPRRIIWLRRKPQALSALSVSGTGLETKDNSARDLSLAAGRSDLATPGNDGGPGGGLAITDEFRGDNARLRDSIAALIGLSDDGALVPHGIGGHARTLLAAAYHRLPGVGQ